MIAGRPSKPRPSDAQDALARARAQARAAPAHRRLDGLRRLGAAAAQAGAFAEGRNALLACAAEAALSALDLYNLGYCCDHLDNGEEAAAHYRAAIALEPGDPRLFNNLGKTLNRLGRLDEAEAALRRALELEPGRPASELNLAFNLLARGRWREAWPSFEARLAVYNVIPPIPHPRWDGRIQKHALLLLRGEQGLGDLIQFGRFASLLGKAGQPVILQADSRLVPLMKTLPNLVDVIGAEKVLNSDRHPIAWAPLLSVPGMIGLDPGSVPAPVPYLRADAERANRWIGQLPQARLRVGVAWQGNPAGEVDRGRSFPLAALAPLAALPGVHLFALQRGEALDQIATAPFGSRIQVPGGDFDRDGAFLDSAAVMSVLDLVVSSDTAIAHLAGALGRPAFVALQRWPDWRWLLDRSDTPWYPSIRLFRQRTAGDWTDVFSAIAAATRDMLHARQ